MYNEPNKEAHMLKTLAILITLLSLINDGFSKDATLALSASVSAQVSFSVNEAGMVLLQSNSESRVNVEVIADKLFITVE